jgi:hypothetical protein
MRLFSLDEHTLYNSDAALSIDYCFPVPFDLIASALEVWLRLLVSRVLIFELHELFRWLSKSIGKD